MDSLADLSGVGLAALVVVLGYYLIIRLQNILTKYLERQELVQQQILIAMLKIAEEMTAINKASGINHD